MSHLPLYTSADLGENMCKVSKTIKFTMWKKVKKNNLTITSKPQAHPHIMKKTHAKFHNNWYKTVRGVENTCKVLKL